MTEQAEPLKPNNDEDPAVMPSVQYININESREKQVENVISSTGIGGRIRKLRLKHSMSLVELGERSGLSASFLSQLETGRVVPTLRNLSRIALVFGRDLEYFFDMRQRSSFRISRAMERTRLALNDQKGGIISESMHGLVLDQNLAPCIAEFPKTKTDASFVPEVFPGEEFVLVLTGAVEFSSDPNKDQLEAGDVLWTDGSVARVYRCRAGQTAKLMIITYRQGEVRPAKKRRNPRRPTEN